MLATAPVETLPPELHGAVQPQVAVAPSPLTFWEADGALILQRGNEAPARFTENAAAASIVSGQETALSRGKGR